jgi:hypothetical protein
MKLTTTADNLIRIEDMFNPIVLVAKKAKMVVASRDDGLEIAIEKQDGTIVVYSLKDGELTLIS